MVELAGHRRSRRHRLRGHGPAHRERARPDGSRTRSAWTRTPSRRTVSSRCACSATRTSPSRTSTTLRAPTASPFGDGRFGPTYQLFDEARAYNVQYYRHPTPYPTSLQKFVKVSVSRPGSDVRDHGADDRARLQGGHQLRDRDGAHQPHAHRLLRQLHVRAVAGSPAPARADERHAQRDASRRHRYRRRAPYRPRPTRRSSSPVSSAGPTTPTPSSAGAASPTPTMMAAPPFRMWTSGRIKFDTYPGGD